MSDDWKPSSNYYVEPQFYKSPKLKDVTIPDDATNVPNSAHQKYTHYYSDEEVLDIWAKPLDSKDYLPTASDKTHLAKIAESDDQLKRERDFRSLVLMGEHAPCNAHIFNMRLDSCDTPDLGQSNKTMAQRSQCNKHFYKFTTCLNKHRKWYDARFKALAEVAPEVAPRFQQAVKYDQDPSLYEEFAPKN